MKKSLILALVIPVSSFAHASDEHKDLTIAGWLDLYYQYDFNHSPLGTSLTGRGFDTRANSFELANLLLSIKYAKKDSPFSLTTDLATGRNAELSSALDAANGNRNQIIQQLFVTFTQKDGSTIDFGKFNTWIGFESPYTIDNPNYSISTLYNYGQPVWNVGLRYTKPINETTTAGIYAVNGWNETQDTNTSKTFGLTYAKTLSKKLSATVGYIGGDEGPNGIGLPNAGLSGVHQLDFIATYAVSDKHTLVFNGDYASSAGSNSGHWTGWSLFSNHKLNDKNDVSLRFSTLQDPNGLRGIGGSIGSLTGTFNLKTSATSTLRFEARNDFSNLSLFESGASGSSKSRTTLTIAHQMRF
jgi:hypothetical protein